MTQHYTFFPHGTCSTQIDLDITDGILHNVVYQNGCSGNLQALGRLVEGMPVAEVISRLRGISCGGGPTSCGDQLACALEKLQA